MVRWASWSSRSTSARSVELKLKEEEERTSLAAQKEALKIAQEQLKADQKKLKEDQNKLAAGWARLQQEREELGGERRRAEWAGDGGWAQQRDRNSLADALAGRRKAKPKEPAPMQTAAVNRKPVRRASLANIMSVVSKARSMPAISGRSRHSSTGLSNSPNSGRTSDGGRRTPSDEVGGSQREDSIREERS